MGPTMARWIWNVIVQQQDDESYTMDYGRKPTAEDLEVLYAMHLQTAAEIEHILEGLEETHPILQDPKGAEGPTTESSSDGPETPET